MNGKINEKASSADFEFSSLREANNYRKALIDEFGKYLNGRVIEIGSGIGQMTGEMLNLSGIEYLQAIEPDNGFCSEFRKNLPSQPLIEGTITDIKSNDWNAIVSINVLEHIEDDRGELERYYKLLRNKKGCVCLFIPARPELYSPIDKDFGHFRRYTKKEIVNKLEEAGFDIVCAKYYNFIGYFAWLMNFRILKSRSFNVSAVRLFDRVIFPIGHWFETHITRPFIGQSLLVIGRAK